MCHQASFHIKFARKYPLLALKLPKSRVVFKTRSGKKRKQVAQWATIAHHGTSIMFGDTIIYDAQRQVTLNLKQ